MLVDIILMLIKGLVKEYVNNIESMRAGTKVQIILDFKSESIAADFERRVANFKNTINI